MAEVDTIDIPDVAAATRTVATMSKAIKTLGLPTDAKSTATDATSVTQMQVLKQVSASIQALQALITSGSLSVFIDADSVNANGQAAMTASAPVVVASDQSAIPVTPGGNVAHDGVDSGSPLKTGGRAVAGLSGLTLVAAADRTDSLHGIDGAQYVRPHCGLEDIVSGVAAITDGSSTSVIASAGAGVKNYITSVMIANTSATAVTVDLRDGAAGTVKATLPVPPNTSGVVTNWPVPLPFSAATAVCADPSAAASTVTVTLIGFKSKV